MLKVGTIFSGIGPFEYTLKKLNISHSIEFSFETNKNLINTYINNHTHQNLNCLGRDWLLEDYSKLPKINILFGRIPNKLYIDGRQIKYNRSKYLVFDRLYDLLKSTSPDYFILEDTVQLSNVSKGKLINVLTDRIADTVDQQLMMFPDDKNLGYSVYYESMNASNYGLPHNFEKLYIIGVKNNLKQEFNFPKPRYNQSVVSDILEKKVGKKYFISKNHTKLIKADFINTCKKACVPYGDISKLSLVDIVQSSNLVNKMNWYNRIYFPDRIGVTISSKSNKIDGILNYYTGLYVINNKIRRLTPRECFRMMGYDDNFKIPVIDGRGYYQAANTTPINILEVILKGLNIW